MNITTPNCIVQRRFAYAVMIILGQAFRNRAGTDRHTHGWQTGLARKHACNDFFPIHLQRPASTESRLFTSRGFMLANGVMAHIEVDT